MTSEDIIRMAKEAGFDKNSLGTTFTHGKLDESLERFANLVAAAAREAGIQEGMKREHAMWVLAKIGQEIEHVHDVDTSEKRVHKTGENEHELT